MIEIVHEERGALVEYSAVKWNRFIDAPTATELLEMVCEGGTIDERIDEATEELKEEIGELENELADEKARWKARCRAIISLARKMIAEAECRRSIKAVFEAAGQGRKIGEAPRTVKRKPAKRAGRR